MGVFCKLPLYYRISFALAFFGNMKNLSFNVKEIAKVNNVAIMASNDPNQLVPIKPICDALGIDAKAQRNRIDRDEILSSTGVIMTSVAADGKEREMYCIPIRYVFGWLFSIDTNRVDEEVRASVIKYKIHCMIISPLTPASSIKSRKDKQKTGPVSKSSKKSSMKRRTN